MDLDILNQCVELLDRSQTVYLFGIGSSLLVARDMYLKLLRVNKACVICDDWHAQLLQARNIRSCDLALIVSYSGLTEEMITCAREARLREAPVITISRFEQSPLVRLADCRCKPCQAAGIRKGQNASLGVKIRFIQKLCLPFFR